MLTYSVDTPETITLVANDEGMPNPPGALDYIVTSLPNHGTLTDPSASVITTVPYILVSHGDQVIFTPKSGCDAPVSFTFKANDGGTAPEGGGSNEATVSLLVPAIDTIYEAMMDTDPGWTSQGQWDWGAPAGQGGARGNPDPASGNTGGSRVLGYNLAGDYSKNMSITEWVTTPAIDCTGVGNVTLDFYRWLNVDSYNNDQAVIEVSSDGSSWTRIWQNNARVTDNSWTLQSFDISSVADDQSAVYLRWGMGPTNNNQNYSGWNIDDVVVTGRTAGFVPVLGDFEPDCDIDMDDLTRLIAYWLQTCGDCEGADLLADGIVNLEDVRILAENWLIEY
ncbi:MAG: choice-of-anchor J domain-containing protein [Planctomycetota bacterium]|jgi:hypothetical protein